MPTGSELDRDLYADLGVSPDATIPELKKARIEINKRLKSKVDKGDPVATEEAAFANAAYDVLADSQKRAEYDQHWASGRSEPLEDESALETHRRRQPRPTAAQAEAWLDDPTIYRVGDAVVHRSYLAGRLLAGFGQGTVRDVREVADGQVVSVAFAAASGGNREIFNRFIGMEVS